MPEMVSVELNGQILKRAEFEQRILEEGDKVEFLYFMGGGEQNVLRNMRRFLEGYEDENDKIEDPLWRNTGNSRPT